MTLEAAMDEIFESAPRAEPDVAGPESRAGKPSGGFDGTSPWESQNSPDPQPLPEELPTVTAFDPLLLPDAFRPWVEDISHRMQCPIDFVAIPTMIALAAVSEPSGRKGSFGSRQPATSTAPIAVSK